MDLLKRFFSYILPYKRYAFLNIFFNILYAIFSSLSYFVLIPLLRIIFVPSKETIKKPEFNSIFDLSDYLNQSVTYHATKLAGEDTSKTLLFVIILIIIVFLLKNAFNYFAGYFITFLSNGVLKDLRNDLYAKTIELPISFFSEKRKGDIMARILGDIGAVQGTFLSVMQLFIKEPLTILVTLVLMLTISVKLTLFVFTLIPLSGIVISRIGKNLKRQSTKVQQEQGYFLSLLEESLGGLKVIKGFNGENEFNAKFRKSTNKFEKLAIRLAHRNSLASPVSEFLGIVVFGILLWFGGKLVLTDKTLSGEQFIGFLLLAYNMLAPAKAVSNASFILKNGNASADRVLEILDTINPLEDKKNAIQKTSFDKEISLKNISFKYQNDYVLKDFSLTIPKGKMVALVGQSGSGKSTIANLLSRFYDVNEGTIEIDGINIKNITKKSLRNLEGLVTQDAILFNDSIKNNVLLGAGYKSDEEIIAAAKVANAHDFISELPKKYETNIGDSGNKLSGGQKQRISIARAVLKNPPIMILDEATSALDTESERLVQDALEKMMENRTSVVIAHRLSTIQKADVIVVMEKGKIVEQGTHKELIAKNGTYRKLVEMQNLD